MGKKLPDKNGPWCRPFPFVSKYFFAFTAQHVRRALSVHNLASSVLSHVVRFPLTNTDHVLPVFGVPASRNRDLDNNDISALPAGLFDGLQCLDNL